MLGGDPHEWIGRLTPRDKFDMVHEDMNDRIIEKQATEKTHEVSCKDWRAQSMESKETRRVFWGLLRRARVVVSTCQTIAARRFSTTHFT